MVRDTFQLTGDAAAIYEEQKVPAVFRPLALATLGALPIHNDEKVLDVACGTGIVGREVIKRLGPSGSVTGIDLNEDMIGMARETAKTEDAKNEWHVADVTALPFEADTFSLVICQQGLQFFPNEDAALREMRRVLSLGGRIAISVWAGPSEFVRSLKEALSRNVGEEVAQKSLAPFQYAGMATLPNRLSSIGFDDISVERLVVVREIGTPEVAIPKEILSAPIGPAVAEQGDAVMGQIVREIMDDLAHCFDGSKLAVHQEANLITGKVRQ